MNRILCGCIFAVTIFLWIPSSYGNCLYKAIAELQTCGTEIIAKFSSVSGNPSTKDEIEMICKPNSAELKLVTDCMSKITDCQDLQKFVSYAGINISHVLDNIPVLCKGKEDLISGESCFNNVPNEPTTFGSLTNEINSLVPKLIKKEINEDYYFEQICPLLKKGMDQTIAGMKCPEKTEKVLSDYFSAIMSDECQRVNLSVQTVSNVYFISLLILITLFLIG
ncbi:uncharacterized protein LOC106869698 [Octopus bimaculoides]|uniref:Uncharacterized protein n=1 Tax=Octopus bimaculoides TaxID=37653 RepID=A0A0L8HP38_OCTBM|nr:uncharacterized protein LOC106869698 [Octopus bimaculoides]|eukprot:XP_014771025.1 PREDICTED: uncharacterized protein LOC106869698 [Octopus bimaculoides]